MKITQRSAMVSRVVRGVMASCVVGIPILSAQADDIETFDDVLGFSKMLITNPDGGGASVSVMTAPPGEIQAFNNIRSSTGAVPPHNGIDVNALLGADRFYNAGINGANSIVANIEAGHVWSGHEALGNVTQQFHHAGASAGAQTGELDAHATWVGTHIAGSTGGANPGEHQRGIADGAELWSGAIATVWSGTRYATGFGFNGQTFVDPYNIAFSSGISGDTADVINSSWGNNDPTGNNFFVATLDGLSNQNPQTTFVASAGNAGPGANTVGGPGAGHNVISVAALGPQPDYDTVSSFSSRGPSPYVDPVNGSIGLRATVDIAAPGQNLTSAQYGGQTGGNAPTLAGAVAFGGVASATAYTGNLAGTSFASPIVAGAATLINDAGYVNFPANPNARDARVVKAVLQNSADKIPGWNNGQFDNAGILTTVQSLDLNSGTGALNLDKAYDQYLSGTTDLPGLGGGMIDPIGWDYGLVSQGAPNDYFFANPINAGTTLTVTLDWFRDRSYVYNPVNGGTAFDLSFDDLDLEIWEVVAGTPTSMIAISGSSFNNVEHLSFNLLNTGDYMIRVNWFQEIFDLVSDVNQETYGLAWSAVAVPVPAAVWAGLSLLTGFGTTRWVRAKRNIQRAEVTQRKADSRFG